MLRKLFHTTSAPLAAVFSSIGFSSIAYIVDRTMKISQFTYLSIQSTTGLILYAPIMYWKGQLHVTKNVTKKDLFKVFTLIEVPTFISEFLGLKAYEHTVALPSAIGSFYPLINLVKDQFISKVYYNTSSNTIIIDEGRNFLLKEVLRDVVCIVLYSGSVGLIYLDASSKEEVSSADVIKTAIYASLSALSTAVAVNFVNKYGNYADKYGNPYGTEVITYSSILTGLPLRIISTIIGYAALKTSSIENDFVINKNDLGIAVGLGALSLLTLLGSDYAFINMKHISDCAFISTVSVNVYSALLDKKFNFSELTVYGGCGLALSIISTFGIVLNSHLKDQRVNKETKSLINLIGQQLPYDNEGQLKLNILTEWQQNKDKRLNNQTDSLFDLIEKQFNHNNEEQLIINILTEWQQNKNFYDTLVTKNNELNIAHYNEILLCIISRICLINFHVKDQNGHTNLLICNNNIEQPVKVISLQIKFNMKDILNNKQIAISDKIEVLDVLANENVSGRNLMNSTEALLRTTEDHGVGNNICQLLGLESYSSLEWENASYGSM